MTQELAIVSFNSTTYTVTEGVDGFAVLLVRSGDTSGATVVTVTTESGTAMGKYILYVLLASFQ